MLDKAWVAPELRKAIEELERLEGDERMREEYEARLDQVRVMATRLQDSFEQGIEVGDEQGAERTKREIALRLLQDGESMERVSRLTGLGLGELQRLARA
jgi:predicted transposase/invertase (TIGR01784 family)